MSEPAEDAPQVYAVRVSIQAIEDIAEATLWLYEKTEDGDLAERWAVGVRDAYLDLRNGPRRFAIAEKEGRHFRRETRRRLFRLSPGGVAYHIFYHVEDEGEDGPRVLVVHVRHAARKPLTLREAKEIQQNL